jgi:hypothetical protein
MIQFFQEKNEDLSKFNKTGKDFGVWYDDFQDSKRFALIQAIDFYKNVHGQYDEDKIQDDIFRMAVNIIDFLYPGYYAYIVSLETENKQKENIK